MLTVLRRVGGGGGQELQAGGRDRGRQHGPQGHLRHAHDLQGRPQVTRQMDSLIFFSVHCYCLFMYYVHTCGNDFRDNLYNKEVQTDLPP